MMVSTWTAPECLSSFQMICQGAQMGGGVQQRVDFRLQCIIAPVLFPVGPVYPPGSGRLSGQFLQTPSLLFAPDMEEEF